MKDTKKSLTNGSDWVVIALAGREGKDMGSF
jgi:allantoicase